MTNIFDMNNTLSFAYAEDAGAANPTTSSTDGTVTQDATKTNATGSTISTVVIMVVMVAVFYFLLIRPQRKKDKAVKQMLGALKVGDRICTIGGIYGTITNMKEDTITLTVGGNQNPVVIARWAIRSVEDAPLENDTDLAN